jgi:hypothetical protein
LLRARFNRSQGDYLASNSKRLDLCAAQMAHLLHAADHRSVEGKVCLEVGSGWVLSHALTLHLLGAQKVICTDIEALTRPELIGTAVNAAIPYIVRDVLSPFCPHPEIRARLDRLIGVERWSLDVLGDLGVEYRAPVDLALRPVGQQVDLIYSLSALEHVAVEDLPALWDNMVADLRPGGTMLHAIHLEDHLDINGAPFPFLGEPAATFGRLQQLDRGNRLRRSGWRDFLDSQQGFDWRFIYEFSREDKPLPQQIDPDVSHEGEADLRVSHIGVCCTKPEGD